MWRAFSNLARRLRQGSRRADFDRQLDDELRFHVDAETEDLVRTGVPRDEARRRAMATFGGFDRWRDEARETRVSQASGSRGTPCAGQSATARIQVSWTRSSASARSPPTRREMLR